MRFPCAVAAAFVVICAAASAGLPKTDAYGIFDVPNDNRSLSAISELGVGWARVQLRIGEPEGDRKLQRLLRIAPMLNDEGVALWLTLYHRDKSNAIEDGTVGYDRASRGGFPVRDDDVFKARVASTVEQFAAQLRDAGRAPGDWLVVQFGNEVIPRDVLPPDRAVRFWHGTGDEYLQMLEAGYAAVKSVDPDIPVASAGLSSASMEAALSGYDAVADWNSRLLREGRADWADVHLRHRLSDVAEKVQWTRERWSGPIASTELAGPDPRTDRWSDEAQLADLKARIRIALEAGVRRVFWAALVDTEHGEKAYENEGLIKKDWGRKQAFGAYRDLIQDAQPPP